MSAQFTGEHEGLKISISKFTKLRRRICVSTESSGTHNVCACVHHEHVILLLSEIDIQHLTEDNDMMLKNDHDSVRQMYSKDSGDGYW